MTLNFSIGYRSSEEALLPHVVKFSGGRSSGMLLLLLLENGLLAVANASCSRRQGTPEIFAWWADIEKQHARRGKMDGCKFGFLGITGFSYEELKKAFRSQSSFSLDEDYIPTAVGCFECGD